MEPAATPSPGRRHLKTLSLSSPSPSSRTSLSRSQNAAGGGPGATSPANTLRLSLRNHAPLDDAILEDAPWTAPVPAEPALETLGEDQKSGPQGSLPSTPARGAYQQHGRTGSDRRALNRLSLNSDISSASSSRSGYRTSWGSSHGGSVDFGSSPQQENSGMRDLAALKKARRTSSISYTRDTGSFSPTPSPVVNRSEAATASPMTPAYPSPLSNSRSPRPVDDSTSSQGTAPASPATSQGGPVTPNKSTGATLVEQHADLLSFIAKKERKCLDLREELKRHDEELKSLKKKWESIVARDQQQQSSLQPGSASGPSLSPNLNGSRSPRQPSSPNSQVTPLDSPSAARSEHDQQPLSMGVGDVAAARKWMGGWMKQGMAGVAGIMEGMSEPRSSTDLGTVREEEEGDDSDAAKDRRSSQASSASTAPTSVHNSGDESLLVKISEEQDRDQAMDRDYKTLLESKHNKRRSTFDMNWGDALKRSQKAALGFVETFERTIADSLVLPPLGEDGHHVSGGNSDLMFDHPGSPSLAPPSPTPSGSRSKTPSPRHSPNMRRQQSFNWDAALDDSGADISSTPLQVSAPQSQPKTAEARVRAAREKHAKRQSMPAAVSSQPKTDAMSGAAGSPELDGWGW